MAEPALRDWTVGEFFAWQEKQSERYELVDGHPLKMMAGAKNVHDDIVVNLIGELREQLRGGGCRPFTGDGSVETRPSQIRRPDVGVDCGPRNPEAMTAAQPKALFEVLSPSTRDFDSFGKLAEYRAMSSVDYVGLIEPNEPVAVFWARGADGQWIETRIEGLDGALELPALKIILKMAAIYEGVVFPASPHLVTREPAAG
jgi:Uma2 family endonuclease